jgi:hypothetical protein
MGLECPLIAEAVEKLGFEVAREFAYFDFARDEYFRGRLYGSTRRQDGVSSSSAGPPLVNGACRRPVGKKFHGMRLKRSFSTASAKSGHSGTMR